MDLQYVGFRFIDSKPVYIDGELFLIRDVEDFQDIIRDKLGDDAAWFFQEVVLQAVWGAANREGYDEGYRERAEEEDDDD